MSSSIPVWSFFFFLASLPGVRSPPSYFSSGVSGKRDEAWRHIVTGYLTVSVLRKELRDAERMLLLRKGGLEGAGQVQISIVSSTIPL